GLDQALERTRRQRVAPESPHVAPPHEQVAQARAKAVVEGCFVTHHSSPVDDFSVVIPAERLKAREQGVIAAFFKFLRNYSVLAMSACPGKSVGARPSAAISNEWPS